MKFGDQFARLALASLLLLAACGGGADSLNPTSGDNAELSSFISATKKASVSAPAPLGSYPNANSALGTNLSQLSYYSTELPFIDAMKSASAWIPQNNTAWNTGESLVTDGNGYVKTIPSSGTTYTKVGTLMFRNMISRYPAGKYVVLYKGSGNIIYGFDAVKNEVESRPGRDIIDVDPSKGGGIYLCITKTDPQQVGDYLRGIHVIPAIYENTFTSDIFNPSFLHKLEKFKVLRFMDWMNTNGSMQRDWTERPQETNFSFAKAGAPVETMVKLSNRIHADPWFNMPHKATDDYISSFATAVKAQLSTDLNIHVEYSNEVWNGIFEQSTWTLQQAQLQWPSLAASDFTKKINWFGQRSAQMCDIWKKVFVDTPGRVQCVMGSQAASTWVSTQALECPLSSIAPCYRHGISALAIAPYFGGYLGDPGVSAQVQQWNVPQLFHELNVGGSLPNRTKSALQESSDWMTAQASIATKYGIKMVAYEGGQHLVGTSGNENNILISELFISANRDSQMKNAYASYLKNWRAAGGTLFVNYSSVGRYSKWGSWGTAEYLDEIATPKSVAIDDFLTANLQWW